MFRCVGYKYMRGVLKIFTDENAKIGNSGEGKPPYYSYFPLFL